MSKRSARAPLTWRPVTPGSDLHLSLMGRTRSDREQLGRLLYPSLYGRRDEVHRRACDEIAAAGRRTKREGPGTGIPTPSVPIDTPLQRRDDGRYTECA